MKPIKAPLYEFTSLQHHGHVVLNHNDAAHAQKNCVAASRQRKRVLVIAGLYMNRAVQLLGNLPPLSYVGKDGQSDRESAWCLNPRTVLSSEWDAVAVTLFQLRSRNSSAIFLTFVTHL